ncbi:hypothetical protein FACS1894184_20410 [Clostridia bacterium]|nr:hypothetical protein FACS1894184_20410 [Clostridia bacterium]
MSQSYIGTTNGYTNLVNPQVYNTDKNLACGWKWTCQDPCCDGAGPWPKDRCSCCDECELDDSDVPDGGEGGSTDSGYTEEPCCYNGTCCPCKTIAGDAPPLYPKAIGCGRRHICKTIKTLPLCKEQLEVGVTENGHADLPGRPPHTIVCVRATGASIVQMEDCMETNDLNLINPDCNSYNLWVRFKIPVEIIVRDCAGYLYCLNSFFTELVRIPLTSMIYNLGGAFIYTKVRVRLCFPNKAEATPLYDGEEALGKGTTFCGGCTGATLPFNCLEAIAKDAFRDEDQGELARCLLGEDAERGCSYEYTFGTYQCLPHDSPEGPNLMDRCSNGNPKLDILIEACVVRLVPENGVNDPYTCVPHGSN